jgi:AmmeMemoRadiSam system protein B
MIFVQDPARGRVLMLRDTEGIAPSPVVLAAAHAAVVARLDGHRDAAEIAADAARAGAREATPALVAQIVAELDAAYLLDTPRFRAKKRDVVRAFEQAETRPAAHAGGSYHADPIALGRFIRDECLARAPARRAVGPIFGLCAPHMDLWRAAVGYGHAYRALSEGLDPAVDTFILLGTSHAPMARPFAVCAKRFATPLGPLAADHDALAELSRRARFDVRADEYLHKGEHSLEFQAVFLRHVLGPRAASARIVPILCGLGDAQIRRRDPARDPDAESFLAALAQLVDDRRGRVLVVAGADLAHVGPRFGDARPLDASGRERLRERDLASVELALARDAAGFFHQVAGDLETRRVCGLGPIYTMLRVLPGGRGEKLHYEQHVDPEEGSIVSHTAMVFRG